MPPERDWAILLEIGDEVEGYEERPREESISCVGLRANQLATIPALMTLRLCDRVSGVILAATFFMFC